MLRLYKPITHDIFKLHAMVRHLVCSVWCEASTDVCETKLDVDFKKLYTAYAWLKKNIDEIYEGCKILNESERKTIKDAFETNNKIEELCKGNISPIYLDKLPEVVEKKIKPLLVDFYEKLLERKLTPGTKKDYYEKLIRSNEFKYCPCCGIMDFEQEDSSHREAFDHYLPKAHYPFASVNFENLVPLCHKCNSDRKGDKDPIEKGRKAFYPFSSSKHNIEIKFIINKTKNLKNLAREDLAIEFIGETEKISTWNSLFDISDRYNDITRSFIETLLRRIKRRHSIFAQEKADWTYENTLDTLIQDYEFDRFEDKKFLKIPLMKDLKNHSHLIEVYG